MYNKLVVVIISNTQCMFLTPKNPKKNQVNGRARPTHKASPLPKMTRHDFHCIANSLNTVDNSKMLNLEELLKKCITKSTSSNPETEDPSRRCELVSEKFKITPALFNNYSESSNLETIEYFVNNFMPVLSTKVPAKTQKFSSPTNYQQKSQSMKDLLGHLMSFYREMNTEVNILSSIKPTPPKLETQNVVQFDLPKHRTPTPNQKYEKQPKPGKKKKPNGVVPLNHSKLSVKKNECIFENCAKEYTTPGALSFHIRTKHNKKTEPLKKEYMEKAKKKKKAKATEKRPETSLGKRGMETSGESMMMSNDNCDVLSLEMMNKVNGPLAKEKNFAIKTHLTTGKDN